MSNTPNMNLTLPVPTSTPGPDYAIQNTEAFETIDEHNHTPGRGVLVPISGININDDVNLDGHKLQNANVLQAENLPAVQVDAMSLNSFQVVNGEAWYVDASSNAVQLTSGGSIVTPAIPGLPPGSMIAYGGISAPSGWLSANGSAVSRTTYAALFAALGTVYGVGDGSTTFNLPDKRGRTSIGAGTYTDPVSGAVVRTQGTKIGAEKHVLITSELASHTHTQNSHNHTQNAHSHSVDLNDGVSGGGAIVGNYSGNPKTPIGTSSTTATNIATTATNQNTGADVAHNNMQPSEVDLWIIKT